MTASGAAVEVASIFNYEYLSPCGESIVQGFVEHQGQGASVEAHSVLTMSHVINHNSLLQL